MASRNTKSPKIQRELCEVWADVSWQAAQVQPWAGSCGVESPFCISTTATTPPAQPKRGVKWCDALVTDAPATDLGAHALLGQCIDPH